MPNFFNSDQNLNENSQISYQNYTFNSVFKTDANYYASMGWKYEHGDGVSMDKSEAVRYYKMAADKGIAFAKEKLSQMIVEE